MILRGRPLVATVRRVRNLQQQQRRCPRASTTTKSTPSGGVSGNTSSNATTSTGAANTKRNVSAVASVGGSSSCVVGGTVTTTATTAVATMQQPRVRRQIGRLLWETYTHALHERPLLTKATMAAFIFFVSDSATQYIMHCRNRSNGENATKTNNKSQEREDAIVEDAFRWDPSRALSGSAFGIVATTWLHSWWGFLEQFIGARLPMANYRLANTLTKVLVDQAIGAPLYIYTYYVITNILGQLSDMSNPNGDDITKAWSDTTTKASDMLWPTMLRHWRVWPIVHSLNFYFVPLHHRVLVQNTALIGWSGYLSYLNHSASAFKTSDDDHTDDLLDEEAKRLLGERRDRLMTPDEEIKVTIIRRESAKRLSLSDSK